MKNSLEQQLERQKLNAPSEQLDQRMNDLFADDQNAPTTLPAQQHSRWKLTAPLALAAALLIALPTLAWFANAFFNAAPSATTPTTANLTTGPTTLPTPLDQMIRFDHTITQTSPGQPMLAQSPPPAQSPTTDDPATRSLPFPGQPTVIQPMLEQRINYTRWHDPKTGVTIEHARPQQNVHYISVPVY